MTQVDLPEAPDPVGAPATPGAFVYDPQLGAGRATPSGFLIDALRRRRVGRLLVSGLTVLLFLAGAGLFTYPFFTDLYTDRVIQDRLDTAFDDLQAADWEAPEAGSPLTRIVIPAIDLSTVVVEGTSPAALRAGAGHYPNTPLPGEVGNVGIAGHRTTYGRPFNRIDELTEGAEIWLITPVGDHLYRVTAPPEDGDCRPHADDQGAPPGTQACVTHPEDWSVVAPADDAFVTLTTCHPKGSARERLIVRAELVDSLPPGGYAEEHEVPVEAAV